MPDKNGGRFIFVIFAIAIALAAGFVAYKLLLPPIQGRTEVLVTIPPDATVYDIDRILAGANVLQRGGLIAAIAAS